MKHLNELSDKYGSKGLSVLALTSEEKEVTEEWIKTHGAEYAYGYDKGGKLKTELGVRGIPNAALVDPSGKIVWQGHPMGLNDEIIESAISGALSLPVYEWPSELSSIKKSIAKGKLSKALADAEKKPIAQETGVLDAIKSMIQGRLAGIRSAMEAGDYLTAQTLIDQSKEGLKGLPEEEELESIEENIDSDPQAREVIKAQKIVRKLITKPLKTDNDRSKMIKQMMKLVRKHEGTIAEREARAYAAKLRAQIR